MAVHSVIECVERLVPCPLSCSQGTVKAKDIHHHVKECCAHRLVECEMGCGKWVLHKDLKAHHQDQCPLRMVPCNLCAQAVSIKHLPQHVREECPMKYVECPLKCLTPGLRRQDLVVHMSSDCPRRILICEKCDSEVVAVSMPSHERGTCPELSHNRKRRDKMSAQFCPEVA